GAPCEDARREVRSRARGGEAGVRAPRAPPSRDEIPFDGPRVHRERTAERRRAGAVDDRIGTAGNRRPRLGRGVLPETGGGPRESGPSAGEDSNRDPRHPDREGFGEIRGTPLDRMLVRDPRRRRAAGSHGDADDGERSVRNHIDRRDPRAPWDGILAEPPLLRGVRLGYDYDGGRSPSRSRKWGMPRGCRGAGSALPVFRSVAGVGDASPAPGVASSGASPFAATS